MVRDVWQVVGGCDVRGDEGAKEWVPRVLAVPRKILGVGGKVGDDEAPLSMSSPCCEVASPSRKKFILLLCEGREERLCGLSVLSINMSALASSSWVAVFLLLVKVAASASGPFSLMLSDVRDAVRCLCGLKNFQRLFIDES